MKKSIQIIVLLISFSAVTFSQQSQRVKIATYNLLNYPSNYSTRDTYFRTIMQTVQPDILVVNEMTSTSGVNIFLSDVLDSTYSAGVYIQGNDTNNALFYKDSLFTFVSNTPIHTDLRDISQFILFSNLTDDTLIIYSAHLKASSGYTNEQQRLVEVNKLRSVTDLLPLNSDYIVTGDFNFYYSSEPGYQKLLDTSTTGFFIDPINSPGSWHNNPSFSHIHTQSTCAESSCPNGGSNGGLDDRFDFILVSPSILTAGKIDYVDSSYTVFGNDGQHFNQSINVPPFTVITQTVANALYNSSDHLPVTALFDFKSNIEAVDGNLTQTINTFQLFQNYPNPFNPVTTIRFKLPKSEKVELKIYDMLGREIKTLYNKIAPAGVVDVDFDADNLPSGVYIYRIKASSFIAAKKLMLLK